MCYVPSGNDETKRDRSANVSLLAYRSVSTLQVNTRQLASPHLPLKGRTYLAGGLMNP